VLQMSTQVIHCIMIQDQIVLLLVLHVCYPLGQHDICLGMTIYSSYISILLLNSENTWELPLIVNGHNVCDIVYGARHDNLTMLLFDNKENNQGVSNHFKVKASTCPSFFMALCNAHLKCIMALYIVCLLWLMLLLMKLVFCMDVSWLL
jgi:hypothetical protein